MSHQAHRCHGCGRTMHWPHTANIGDRWRCRECGAISILAKRGRKGWIAPSTPDAVDNNPDFLPASPGGQPGTSPAQGEEHVPQSAPVPAPFSGPEQQKDGEQGRRGCLGFILLGLLVIDLIVPDPLPLLDEGVLLFATLWYFSARR